MIFHPDLDNKVTVTLFEVEGEPGAGQQKLATVFFQDCWWIVPNWHLDQEGRAVSPARGFLLDSLDRVEVNEPTHRFVLNTPIPRRALQGEDMPAFATMYFNAGEVMQDLPGRPN